MYNYTTKDITRFWSKINKNGSIPTHCPELGACWEWQKKSRLIGGYGYFHVGGHIGLMLLSHRVTWEITHGAIPDGLWVLHKCDNRACCNPSHLFLGTHNDNMKDMVSKDRHYDAKGEKNSNCRFTDEQIEEIRSRYKAGGILQKELAFEYKTSQNYISSIVNYRRRSN